MKNLHMVLCGLFISVLMSCSSDAEKNDKITKTVAPSNSARVESDFDTKIQQNEDKLRNLLVLNGYSGMDDENLTLGILNDNQQLVFTDFQRELLNLYSNLIGLEAKYDADFQEFEFVSSLDNNGFAVIVGRGNDKYSGSSIATATDVVLGTNGIIRFNNEIAVP